MMFYRLNPVMEELKSIKILIQERDGEINTLQTTVINQLITIN